MRAILFALLAFASITVFAQGPVFNRPPTVVNITGNAATATLATTATTAINQSGGTVNATTGAFSAQISKTNTAATSSRFMLVNGSTTAETYAQFTNTTGALLYGVESSVGGQLAANSAAYSSLLGTQSATSLHLVCNGTVCLTLASGGGLTVPTLTTAAGTPNSICQNSVTKEITVNAASTCTVSSARFKDDIQPFRLSAMHMVAAIEPDTFYYKDRTDRSRIGLIAENLASVDPRLAEWDAEGRPNSIDFPAIMAMLIKAAQEQQAELNNLKRELENLRRQEFIAASLH